MKKLILTSVIMLLFAAGSMLKSQNYPEEYLGLPGDNLNLYAVMDLFRESATLEAFERSLNDPDKIINNLDLNGDNYVDYITVLDYVDGNVHNIVLRVSLSESEFQDVAVFTVEQFADGSVRIQLIGDEALYGKNYILEPIYDERPNPGYKGNNGSTASTGSARVVTTYYHVAAWPVVRYIYMPTYVVYRSPWSWGYYPTYWVHWSPHYWHFYYGYHYNWYSHYYSYYRPWPYYRYPRYHTYYYNGIRHRSPQVVVWVREGNYRSTYSRPAELSRGKNHYHTVSASRTAGDDASSASGRSAVTERTPTSANSSSNRARTVSTSSNTSNRSAAATRANSTVNTRTPGSSTSVRATETAPRQTGKSSAVRTGSTTTTRTTGQSTTVRSSGNTRPQSAAPAISSGRSAGTTTARPAATSSNPSSSRGSSVSTPARSSRGSSVSTPSRSSRGSSVSAPARSSRGSSVSTPSRSSRGSSVSAPSSSSRGSSVSAPSSSSRGSSVSAPAARSSSNTGATRSASPARTR